MGNCLVTKLKGVVENDNLPILGKLAFNEKKGSGNSVYGLKRIELSEGSYIDVQHGTIGGETRKWIGPNDYKYLVDLGAFVVDEGYNDLKLLIPKYIIKRVTYLGDASYPLHIDMNDYSYCNLIEFAIDNGKASVVIINKSVIENLETFNIGSCTIEGEPFDVTDLGLNGIITTLNLGSVKNLKGSLNNLGFSPISILFGPNTKNVSFNIEQFVANSRTAGRTTGSLSLPWIGACNCTFNGAAVVNQNSNSLSWTATTITFNDVTIDA
jgi:hypothetical protein